MADRFTERAQRVILIAQEEAKRLKHDYVGTEHILLAVIALPDCGAAHVLAELRVDFQILRSKIERTVGTGDATSLVGEIPFTPGAKEVLECAVEEAMRMSSAVVGSEHLLLGLILQKEGAAAHLLEHAGLSLIAVRLEVSSLPRRTPGLQGTVGPQGGDIKVPRRLTERAQKVILMAEEEAQQLNHRFIDTEHILLGVADVEECVAARALAKLGTDLKSIRSTIMDLVEIGDAATSLGLIPFTPGAKKALERAVEEAEGLGHTYVGTEHLLLGLIREGEGLAAQVLAEMGVRLDAVRREILCVLES